MDILLSTLIIGSNLAGRILAHHSYRIPWQPNFMEKNEESV